MIDSIIPLIGAYFSSGMAVYYFYPLIALAFIACVPSFFRKVFRD